MAEQQLPTVVARTRSRLINIIVRKEGEGGGGKGVLTKTKPLLGGRWAFHELTVLAVHGVPEPEPTIFLLADPVGAGIAGTAPVPQLHLLVQDGDDASAVSGADDVSVTGPGHGVVIAIANSPFLISFSFFVVEVFRNARRGEVPPRCGGGG